MLFLLLGALGTTSLAYMILRYWWPTFFLDMYYERRHRQSADSIATAIKAGKFFIDLFEDQVAERGSKAFILYEDQTFTYKETDMLANQAARAALEIGLKTGDNVALLCHNEPGFVYTHLGKSMDLQT